MVEINGAYKHGRNEKKLIERKSFCHTRQQTKTTDYRVPGTHMNLLQCSKLIWTDKTGTRE